jgi:hypothetical protein
MMIHSTPDEAASAADGSKQTRSGKQTREIMIHRIQQLILKPVNLHQ